METEKSCKIGFAITGSFCTHEKIKEIISKDQFLLQSFNNIKTIKGVGDITAIVLLHLFLKYPSANQRQIVSLTGL